jgi:hypothetical protein
MSNILQWSTGLNGYKKHTLHDNHFTTELTECQYELGRNVNDIFYDHLVNRPNSPVELLYSGGTDSELVLMSLMKNKIPFEVMTMVIRTNGLILNTTDLYYSEKFCRENSIKQNLFYFDPIEFYEGGRYLEYLLPYNIDESHVASHFWLIEQCSNYPIIGGDWPWVQIQKHVLSPQRLSYNCYERFMEYRGIHGIGNMISHSFESTCKFIELQITHHTNNIPVPYLKQKMYGNIEPRLRSYGWEQCSSDIFNIKKYKLELLKKPLGITKSNIVWGDIISNMIGSSTNSNTLFA